MLYYRDDSIRSERQWLPHGQNIKDAQHLTKIERKVTILDKLIKYKVNQQKVGANVWEFAAMGHSKAFCSMNEVEGCLK